MSYRIADEPTPSGLARLAVNPFWPLLAVMMSGTWLAWPWFALNSFAVGSPTRRRELALVIGGFAGVFALLLVLGTLVHANWLGASGVQYAAIVVTVFKLATSYWLYTLQSRSFHLYEYFGGPVKSGLLALVLGGFARRTVVGASDAAVWQVMLS